MTGYPTHTWERVVAFYRGLALRDPALAAMADLVERVAGSPYAAALYPVTSHHRLRLFAQDRFAVGDDEIQVEHDGEAFRVRYTSALGRAHTIRPMESRWETSNVDGWAALHRCVEHLGWLVGEGPDALDRRLTNR